MERSYYQILGKSFYSHFFIGIDNLSSIDEIKKAYRTLSLVYHPDKQLTNATEDQTGLFIEATGAYKFLLANKQIYDNIL